MFYAVGVASSCLAPPRSFFYQFMTVKGSNVLFSPKHFWLELKVDGSNLLFMYTVQYTVEWTFFFYNFSL